MRKAIMAMAVIGALAVAGCGGGTGSSSSSTSSGSSDLSGIAKTPDSSWHDQYMAGSHSGMECGTSCHTLPLTNKRQASTEMAGGPAASMAATAVRQDICAQCHMANYNAATLFKHASYNVGTYCNSCHYSDSFKLHSRATTSDYHSAITASCESCHVNRYPSSHASSGRTSNCAGCHTYNNGTWAISSGAHTHTSGCAGCHSSKKPANHTGRDVCEKCHKYPTWSGATMDHTGISSGCGSCHSGHYGGYSCEGCHTQGISWSFRHGSVSSGNCMACHENGFEDEGGGGDDD